MTVLRLHSDPQRAPSAERGLRRVAHLVVLLMLGLGLLASPLSAWAAEPDESAAEESEPQEAGGATDQDLADEPGADEMDDADEEPDSKSGLALRIAEISLDVLLLRPIGALSTVVGGGFFVASAPFVAPSWAFADTWDQFVATPVDSTFRRPLGEI